MTDFHTITFTKEQYEELTGTNKVERLNQTIHQLQKLTNRTQKLLEVLRKAGKIDGRSLEAFSSIKGNDTRNMEVEVYSDGTIQIANRG